MYVSFTQKQPPSGQLLHRLECGPGDDLIGTLHDNAVDLVDCGPGVDSYDQPSNVGQPDRPDVFVNCEVKFS